MCAHGVECRTCCSAFLSLTPSAFEPFRAQGVGARGAVPLARSLALNAHLQALDLGDNGLKAAGIGEIVSALTGGGAPALRLLSLRQNQAGEDGADSICALLQSAHPLTSLDLAGNALGNKGVARLAEGLAANRTVSALCLEHNEIDSEGAERLAPALASNAALTSLSLEWNQIGPPGGKALAEALRESHAHSSLGSVSAPLESRATRSAAGSSPRAPARAR